jgi:ribosomal-protein-alanine N-acetyltransferase
MRQIPHPSATKDPEKFLQHVINAEPPTKFDIEIAGEVSRGIGITIGDNVHRHVGELGYWLGEAFWSHGVMGDAVGAFTDYSSKTLPLHRGYAKVFANNPTSVRVLEKNGFTFEGRLKNNIFEDEEILDSLDGHNPGDPLPKTLHHGVGCRVDVLAIIAETDELRICNDRATGSTGLTYAEFSRKRQTMS